MDMKQAPFKLERNLIVIYNDVLETLVTFGFIIDLHNMFSHLGGGKDSLFCCWEDRVLHVSERSLIHHEASQPQ